MNEGTNEGTNERMNDMDFNNISKYGHLFALGFVRRIVLGDHF